MEALKSYKETVSERTELISNLVFSDNDLPQLYLFDFEKKNQWKVKTHLIMRPEAF